MNLYRDILMMTGSLENYQESSRKEIPKDERGLRKICFDARTLLTALGERNVSDWELRHNSRELKEFLNDLKTLSHECDNEAINTEVIRLSYQRSVTNTPYVLRELFEYYTLIGPKENKRL